MKKIKSYTQKFLIPGSRMGLPGEYYVAVPQMLEGYRIEVHFGGFTMMVEDWKKAATFRHQPNVRNIPNGLGIVEPTFLLGYFEWKPK